MDQVAVMFAGAIDDRAECDDTFANMPMGLDNEASGYTWNSMTRTQS